MRFHTGVALGLMLVSGCGDGTSPEAGLLGEGGRQISGQVVALTFEPESSYVGVAGVEITILQTSTDSGDSVTTPPDSMVPLMTLGRFIIRADSIRIDTIPGDTTHTDSTFPPPPDTIPSDTTTPPPPVGFCGRPGAVVGTVTTDATGHFTVSGLSAGSYDLAFVPPAGSHLAGNIFCGANLSQRESLEVQVYLPSFTDSTARSAMRLTRR